MLYDENGGMCFFTCFSKLVKNEAKPAIIYIRFVNPVCNYKRTSKTLILFFASVIEWFKYITEAVVQRCSVIKGVLRNLAKFTEKHLCQCLFVNKVAGLKAPEHECIFSKFSWNLIKNITLIIFRRVAWNYFNNCLRISVFMSVFFWKQMKFLNFNWVSNQILNFVWRQKMRFFIFRKYYRKIILCVACSKYYRNI